MTGPGPKADGGVLLPGDPDRPDCCRNAAKPESIHDARPPGFVAIAARAPDVRDPVLEIWQQQYALRSREHRRLGASAFPWCGAPDPQPAARSPTGPAQASSPRRLPWRAAIRIAARSRQTAPRYQASTAFSGGD